MCDVYGQCCPVGNSCRFSDATWIQLEPEDATGDGVGQGRIARPSSGTNWDGYSFFVIDGVQGPYVGEPITKVGQTTGRTDGYITGTNVHVRSFASDQIWLLYQHRASYRTSPGDSGGPVFHVTNNGLDVYLEGINWGHFGDNEYDAIFSDAQYINLSQDIGANLYYALPPGGGGSK
jgi:hypothetical protein